MSTHDHHDDELFERYFATSFPSAGAGTSTEDADDYRDETAEQAEERAEAARVNGYVRSAFPGR